MGKGDGELGINKIAGVGRKITDPTALSVNSNCQPQEDWELTEDWVVPTIKPAKDWWQE